MTVHAGRTLEETAALFDGDELHLERDLVVMGGEAATAANSVNGIVTSPRLRRSESAIPKEQEWKTENNYFEMRSRTSDDIVSRADSDIDEKLQFPLKLSTLTPTFKRGSGSSTTTDDFIARGA